MKTAKLTISLSLAAALVSVLFADIIHVPDDFDTIDGAIQEAAEGDTILIADGEYTGNGNVNMTVNEAIVIISENGPENCIIDCENADATKAMTITSGAMISGITMTGGTSAAMTITGAEDFIIQNCVIISNVMPEGVSGGGISVSNSQGLIELTIFSENEGESSGAGLFTTDTSQVEVNNCIFIDNQADRFGGGILVNTGSTGAIINCIFEGNGAGIDGGGIAVTQTSNSEISFCTLVNNRAGVISDNGMGGGLYKGSDSNPVIINSIFWGNEAPNGNQLYAQDNGGEITISYCNVEGGVNEDDLWDGEEIMNENPGFVEGRDPIWGLNSYFLEAESPCIDVGSDTADELGMNELTTQTDLSPDEDVADLGFHYNPNHFPVIGTLEGYVRCARTEEPIEGATVTTSNLETAETNQWGYWFIGNVIAEQEFEITASAEGWHDSTLFDQSVGSDETLEINFYLLHGQFEVSEDDIHVVINEGETTDIELIISNQGNGTLTWMVDNRPPGGGGEAWDLRHSYQISEITGDSRIEGAVFTEDYFYVSGANQSDNDDGVNLIYKINRDGELIDTMEQVGDSRNGMKDLAWDGELIWGSGERNIMSFTPNGEPVDSWNGPYNSNQALAWDCERELLWIASITGNFICGYDSDGNLIREIDRHELRIYGLANWSDDPDGYSLYVIYSIEGSGMFVSKINPDTDQIEFVRELVHEDDGRPGGAFISNQYDDYSWVFVDIANNGSDDRIDLWHLSTNLSWIQIDPEAGELAPEESQGISILMDVNEFQPDTLEWDLVFTHDGSGGETIVHITLVIRPINDVKHNSETVASQFSIISIYPNPFNSSSTITYSLPVADQITVRLYDIHGRQVLTLIDQNRPAGEHNLTLNGSDLSAGIYLCRFKFGKQILVRKIILIK
ncbi:T9SS type A sorting domain-containing protein [bacterium]|nr:T9SS type A sorting domain-containing protein [bacterium]